LYHRIQTTVLIRIFNAQRISALRAAGPRLEADRGGYGTRIGKILRHAGAGFKNSGKRCLELEPRHLVLHLLWQRKRGPIRILLIWPLSLRPWCGFAHDSALLSCAMI